MTSLDVPTSSSRPNGGQRPVRHPDERTGQHAGQHAGQRPGQRSRRRRPSGPRPDNAARPGNTPRNDTPRNDNRGRPAFDATAAPAADANLATDFDGFGLPPALVKVLARAGITRPTPIQSQSLPDALAGLDVLGRAQTGSGKTLAFGLPLLTRIAGDNAGATGSSATRRPAGRHPRGLILLPTRELAQQVQDALVPLADALGLRLLVVVGGTSIGRQIDELRRGVDVVVATPGRLIDLMDRRAVALGSVSVAVLDEADHMADLGFLPAVTRILDALPRERQCLLFSATLDRGVDRIVARYLSRPAQHTAHAAGTPTPDMDHRIFRLARADKIEVASELADRGERTLFFVRTKHGADRLARQMRSRGVAAVALHGNLNQNQRRRALEAFSSGQTPALVATDVAARGLHVDDLDLVVHFDPPVDHKAYSHRSGRTARAGASGTVITFVEPEQNGDVARIHSAARVTAQATVVRPGHPAIRELAPPSR